MEGEIAKVYLGKNIQALVVANVAAVSKEKLVGESSNEQNFYYLSLYFSNLSTHYLSFYFN